MDLTVEQLTAALVAIPAALAAVYGLVRFVVWAGRDRRTR